MVASTGHNQSLCHFSEDTSWGFRLPSMALQSRNLRHKLPWAQQGVAERKAGEVIFSHGRPKTFTQKGWCFFQDNLRKKTPEVFFQDNLRKKTPEVCNENIIETLNWCLHHSATDLIFQTKRLKSYSGKRPQTVWGVRSQCTKYKQEQLWNSNRSGQTLAQLQQQDLLYRSI